MAFAVELMYGVLCWSIYGGSRALLWFVVAGNLADITGPAHFLAGRPMLIVTLILAQVAAMLVLVGLFSSKPVLPHVPGHTARPLAPDAPGRIRPL